MTPMDARLAIGPHAEAKARTLMPGAGRDCHIREAPPDGLPFTRLCLASAVGHPGTGGSIRGSTGSRHVRFAEASSATSQLPLIPGVVHPKTTVSNWCRTLVGV